MATGSKTAWENVPADLAEDKIEDKIDSASISSLEGQVKLEDPQNDASITTTPAEQDPTPNNKSERLLACLQVVGSFSLMFNSWGVVNTFGAYQIYYEGALLKHVSPSNIAWIGSTQATLLLVVGGLSGPIYDAGYLRAMVFVGSAFAVFGMMMTSICKEYWQVILAQGVVVGCGMGCMMLPSIAVMPQYFKTRRAFATGIAASGSSLGGVIYPTVFHKLQPRIGFGWSTRVIAFIMLGTLIVPIVVMRAKVFPAKSRPLFDAKVFRKLPFDLFNIGAAFGFMGMYIPFYFMPTYAISHHIVDANVGFYLLTIINTGSIFGRLVPNFFADIWGPLNILVPWCICCGAIAYAWTSATTVTQVVFFCIFYGFFSGTFVSVIGPALVTISPDLSLVGTHLGMCFGICALTLLIGNPIAGVLLDKYGYLAPAMFCGTTNVLAAIFILAARISKTGFVLKVNA